MTRAEMVTEYNFWVSKRECYKEKISTNAALKESISAELYSLSSNMSLLSAYSEKAVIFGQLYSRNYNMYNETEIESIIAVFDEVASHLESVKSTCQSQINYYDSEIKKYDEAQRIEAERKKAEQAESEEP